MLSRGEVRGLDRINVDTDLADRRPSLLLIRQNVHTALPLNRLCRWWGRQRGSRNCPRSGLMLAEYSQHKRTAV